MKYVFMQTVDLQGEIKLVEVLSLDSLLAAASLKIQRLLIRVSGLCSMNLHEFSVKLCFVVVLSLM